MTDYHDLLSRYLSPERGFFSHAVADDWPQGLMIGNGSLGAIVMGRPHKECLMVSHEELFLPLFEQRPVLDMVPLLPEIRRLVAAGRGYDRADAHKCGEEKHE